MAANTDDNKRKSPRIGIEQMLLLHGQKEVIFAKANDISETGLSFTTPAPIEPNTHIKSSIALQFTEDKKEIINCEGLVIYCCKIEDTFSSGMEFSNISDEHKKILKEFVTTS